MYDRFKYRVYYTLTRIWFTALNHWLFLLHGVKGGSGLKAQGMLYIKNIGRIQVGKKVTLNSAGWANPVGFSGKLYLQTFAGGNIIIGDETGISNAAISSAAEVRIGNRVMIGADTKIYDTDFHPLDAKDRYEDKPAASAPVVIEDDVFIGSGCIILKGSHIQAGSIIGAGSVVSGQIPAGQIWAGNPAKFIRYIHTEEIGVGETPFSGAENGQKEQNKGD